MIANKLLSLLNDNILNLKITQSMKFNGHSILQFHLIKNSNNKYLLNYGPAAEENNLNFILTEVEAFKNLAAVVNNFENCKIQFHNLVLPIGPAYKASKDFNDKVFIRIIEYYNVYIDEILTRYDILIEKV